MKLTFGFELLEATELWAFLRQRSTEKMIFRYFENCGCEAHRSSWNTIDEERVETYKSTREIWELTEKETITDH